MSSGKVIPSLPDYQRIEDPVAREYIAAVHEILLVRNGDKGSGDNAFLTKLDVKALVGDDNFNLLTANANQNVVGSSGLHATAKNAIKSLQREIASNPLSVYLAETIALIKRPTTGVLARIEKVDTQFAATNNVVAAIQAQQLTLTNSFAATALLVTTVQSRIDNIDGTASAVSIEQKFLTLVNRDNFLLGQYTVKIDLNGYVVGFGLVAIDNGSGPSSLFLIRADRFAIGAPGLNQQIPFIVDATDHRDVNGVRHPNGAVYIEDAVLAKFVADEGNIGALTVGTLKIKDNAVTVPGSVGHGGGVNIPYGSWNEIMALMMDFTDLDGSAFSTTLYIIAMLQVIPGGGPYGNTQIDLRVLVDGAVVSQFGQSFMTGFGGSVSCTGSVTTSGVRRVSVQISQSFGAFPYSTGSGTLYAIGTKK